MTAVGDNRSIWALGLRNPFTFGFHPTSGRMFINDVGQSTWEEINDGIAGSNYGWNLFEGPGVPPPFRNPLYAYQHTSGTPTGCAIVGGAFYDSATGHYPPDFAGDYFFADLCSGWVWRYDIAAGTATEFITGISTPGGPEDRPPGQRPVLPGQRDGPGVPRFDRRHLQGRVSKLIELGGASVAPPRPPRCSAGVNPAPQRG